MEEYDPSTYHNQNDSLSNIPVTDLMIEHLRATKPWVRFISVIAFVMTGLMVLFGIVMIFIPMPAAEGFRFGPVLGIVYILFAGIYLAPAFFLHQYASSIGDLLKGGGDVAMEAALGSQKSFWRFSGILTLVGICIYALVIVVAILFGMISAMIGMR